MALRDKPFYRLFHEARDRLLKNPEDNLSDLLSELKTEEERFERNCRVKALRQLIVDGLFDGDLKSARTVLAKLILLRPSKRIDHAEAARFLEVVYRRWMAAHNGDLQALVSDINHDIEADIARNNIMFIS